MLTKIQSRQEYLGLSLRSLAKQLKVSPALLSLVLNGKREPSSAMVNKLSKWLATPVATEAGSCPSRLIDQFIDERASYLAPSTIDFYRKYLNPYAVWCENRRIQDIRCVERTDISEYLSFIRRGRSRTGRPLNAGAIKLHHQTLKTLFNYVGDVCDVPESWKNPLNGIKVKGSQAKTLEYSDEEITRMFEIVDSRDDELTRLRNRALLSVLLNSAVRAAELLAMDVSDLGADGRIKVTGKGGKQRVVTVAASGLKAIREYLDCRRNRTGALWQTCEGTRLSTDGLRSFFARVEKNDPDVFPDGLYAHRFRHTVITRLLRARVPLRSVQRYAGHTDPQTTLRYAQAIDVDEAIEAVGTLFQR